MTAYWVTGDTLTTLRQMPDASVDMVMTSPPFLALRSYLPADDPAKAQEIGQEGSPGAFLDVLLDITEELRRVLAPHGSICVELGDTYSGSGGGGGDYLPGGLREGQQVFGGSAKASRDRHDEACDLDDDCSCDDLAATMRASNAAHWRQKNERKDEWPEAKSACLIPELYRIALAYGVNPLTGRTTPRWRVRNTVRWVRPNPPVGALGDKFRPATSDMVIATMARDRYFDLDAVREPAQTGDRVMRQTTPTFDPERSASQRSQGDRLQANNPAGAPPLDWWEIPTHPYSGSHYATFPPKLVEKPIKAMCPQRVCTTCGEPSRRITGEAEYVDGAGRPAREDMNHPRKGGVGVRQFEGSGDNTAIRVAPTLGWSDCGHDAWRNGRVLDIFGGSGTTLAVATGHGRDAIGIDLDARNVDLARERIGPMFFVEVTVAELTGLLEPTGEVAA